MTKLQKMCDSAADASSEASSVSPMRAGWLTVPIVGLLVLAAHFLRFGDMWLAVAIVATAGLCLTRLGWARLVCSVALFVGSFLWVKTGIDFVQIRMAVGQPWMRLAVIMASICAFSLLGAWLLSTEKAAARFYKGSAIAISQAAVFVLTCGGLWLCRIMPKNMTLLLADRFLPGSGAVEIFGIAVYAAWLCGLLLNKKTQRKARSYAWAFFSFVFFGQLALGLLGFMVFLMTGSLHLPVPALIVAGPLFRGSGFFMLILFTVSVLLVGPAWCSHLCYIGAWDDRMGRVRKGKTGCLPVWAPRLRIVLAVIVFATALGMGLSGVSVIVAVWLAAILGLIGVASMLCLSRRMKMMVHCSAFCPLGVMSNLLGKISPWRLRFSDACTKCNACASVCRYNAITPERLELGKPAFSCSLCRDCTAVCRHGAAEVRFLGITSPKLTNLFVVLVTSLHAIFLGVARM
ncbi:4Fe-4S binding protein [Halodesulfovibrio marinisediminis]|uniref:4Fe-4S binding domain-containing protein n=1 Tax=Halodesulfovibrio marinisediminis DSM 17456 TaxID=1121457 RepID=A0A1N6IEB2_9BACT|nr:4Fe-4S binding protein [Halodesulfovibrio marinisediminis]SIO30384.1 4Fe-4S binding domain-containing protein [Halodesulfovibrio marinisediminis DSM 17456]